MNSRGPLDLKKVAVGPLEHEGWRTVQDEVVGDQGERCSHRLGV